MCQARLMESRQLKSRMRRDAAWGEKGGLHRGGPTAEGRAGFLKFKLEWVRSKPSGRNSDTKILASPPRNESGIFF